MKITICAYNLFFPYHREVRGIDDLDDWIGGQESLLGLACRSTECGAVGRRNDLGLLRPGRLGTEWGREVEDAANVQGFCSLGLLELLLVLLVLLVMLLVLVMVGRLLLGKAVRLVVQDGLLVLRVLLGRLRVRGGTEEGGDRINEACGRRWVRHKSGAGRQLARLTETVLRAVISNPVLSPLRSLRPGITRRPRARGRLVLLVRGGFDHLLPGLFSRNVGDGPTAGGVGGCLGLLTDAVEVRGDVQDGGLGVGEGHPLAVVNGHVEEGAVGVGLAVLDLPLLLVVICANSRRDGCQEDGHGYQRAADPRSGPGRSHRRDGFP